MKIAFISPRILPHAMNFAYCLDLINVSFSHIPLPLATLAALTPPDIEVEIIDENVESISLDYHADIIAFTGILCQSSRLFELADRFKQQGQLVVIGGQIVVDMQDQCSAHADVVFVGEAEYTWPKFLQDYKNGNFQRIYHQKDWIKMKDSPIPRFDLLKVKKYASACVQATRGCSYSCDYCDVPVKYGNTPRSKPIENVLQEVEQLSQLGFDSIFFVDEHFAGNRKYAKDLLQKLAERVPTLPTKMVFYTQVTLNIAQDEELLALFAKAYFTRFFIGIESPNYDKLCAMNKRHNTAIDLNTAAANIQSYGITVWAGILFNFDDDDLSCFDEQYQAIMESSVTPTLVGLIQAMPGTALYERSKKEGRFLDLPSIIGSAALGDTENFVTSNLVPQKISISELNKNVAAFVDKIYEPKAFGDRLIRGASRATRSPQFSWPTINYANIMLLLRGTFFYLFRADPETKKLFFRVIGSYFFGQARNLNELLFHLVAYKHLQIFYRNFAKMLVSIQ